MQQSRCQLINFLSYLHRITVYRGCHINYTEKAGRTAAVNGASLYGYCLHDGPTPSQVNRSINWTVEQSSRSTAHGKKVSQSVVS